MSVDNRFPFLESFESNDDSVNCDPDNNFRSDDSPDSGSCSNSIDDPSFTLTECITDTNYQTLDVDESSLELH